MADRSPQIRTLEADNYFFGPFRFDANDRLLTRAGTKVRLTPRAADMLLALLRRAGHVVGKEEFIRDVWRSAFVEDGTLTFHIHLIRQALGDGVGGQRFIETLPKRGYRFVAPVHRAPQTAAPQVVPPGQEPVDTPVRATGAVLSVAPPVLSLWSALGAQALLAIVVSILVWTVGAASRRHVSSPLRPRVVGTSQLTHDRRPKDPQTPLRRDATQLYFAPIGFGPLKAVSFEGGETRNVPRFDAMTRIVDISRDGSEYLTVRFATPNGGHLWTVPREGGLARRVGVSQTTDASWSPDRARLAFVNQHGLWIARNDGTVIRRVAQFAGSVGCPRWSPDGRLLRFIVGVPAAVTSVLWEVSVDGSNPHVVIPAWKNAYVQGCGTWMPDGRTFVFDAIDTRDPSQPGTPAPQGRHDLWALADGSDRPIQITSGPMSFAAPSPSPDGRRIYALGVLERAELVRYDQQLRDFVPYLDGISARWVNFSRDGRRIVYVRNPDCTVWESNLDGTDKRQLTFAPFFTEALAWSPDGKWVAVLGKLRGEHTKIFLIPSAGGQPVPITSDDVAQGIPTWSADSTRIAFGDVPAHWEQPSGSEVIHVYDIDTRRFSVLAGSQHLWSPRWSPDGRYIAALTIMGQKMMLLDLQTGQWRSMPDEYVEEPAWSRDGRFIFHTTDTRAPRVLRRLRVSDGWVEDLTAPDQFPTTTPNWIWAGVSYDGSPIVLRKVTPTEVYALTIEWR